MRAWGACVALGCALVVWHGAVRADTIYVSPGGSGTGDDPGDPTSLTNGVAIAVGGDTVLLADGTYTVTNQVTVNAAIVLRGASGRDAAVVAGDWTRKPWSVIKIDHPGATLCSLTVSNGYGDQLVGGGVRLDQGTVSNVLFTHCRTGGSSGGGGGLYMTGGFLVDAEFYASDANGQYGGGGGAALNMAGGDALRLTIRNGMSTRGAVRMNGGTLRQSVISGNTASLEAGVYMNGGLMENCLIVSNTATHATDGVGGVYQLGGRLVHVTVADNLAPAGALAGGIYATGGVASNSIAWNNRLGLAANDFPTGGDTYARYTTASDLSMANGNKNSDPGFTTLDGVPYQLSAGSPCIDAASNVMGIATDLAGTNRVIDGNGDSIAIADMGAYEAPELAEGALFAGIQALSPATGLSPLDVELQAIAAGSNTEIAWYGWDFDDDGTPDLSGPGLEQVTNTFTLGRHTVRLWITNSTGTGATAVSSNLVSVVDTNIYVSHGGTHTYPFETLDKGSTNLLTALLSAVSGCAVNVDTGTYAMATIFVVDSAVTVRGIDGPDDTVVKHITLDRVSMFQLTHADAFVHSLTFSNGLGDAGGAIDLDSGTVSNCVFRRNKCGSSNSSGGSLHVSGGRVVDCDISESYAGTFNGQGNAIYMSGGEVKRCTIHDCGRDFGGSTIRAFTTIYASGGTMRECIVSNNATKTVGGIQVQPGATVNNCLVAANTVEGGDSSVAGGIHLNGGQVLNCTVVANACAVEGDAGGVYLQAGGMTNSIVYLNERGGATQDVAGTLSLAAYSCAPELASGTGNITSDPKFENASAGDYSLSGESPCLNAGLTLPGMHAETDLRGGPRLVGSRVDMGAYENTSRRGVVMTIR